MKTNDQMSWRENLAENNPRFRKKGFYEIAFDGRRLRRKMEREFKKELKRSGDKSLIGGV